MEKLKQFFKDTLIGKILLQVIILILGLVPNDSTVPFVKKLIKFAEENNANGIRKWVGPILAFLALIIAIGTYFGIIPSETLEGFTDIINDVGEFAPDSIEVDSIPIDTLR